MRTVHALVVLVLLAAPALAEDEAARKVLDRFEALWPADDDLAIYRLDWADSIEAAKERAAVERRPILLVLVANGHGNIKSGHC